MKRAYFFLGIFFLFSFSQAQVISPFAFEGQRVTSVSLSKDELNYSKALAVAVEDSGVYYYLTNMDCGWQSLGLQNRSINDVYVQIRGTGPLDYFRVYAALFPECYTTAVDSTEPEILFYKDILEESQWMHDDSGLTSPCCEYPTEMDGFDFGGQQPARPVFACSFSSLYRQTDSTWINVSPDIGSLSKFQFVKTFAGDPRVFCGGSTGLMNPFLYYSEDYGQSWREAGDSVFWAGGDNICYDMTLLPDNSAKMYAAMYTRLLVSNDSGATWQQTGLNETNAPVRGVATAYDNQDFVFAYLQTDTATIYESNDSGISWRKIHNPNRHFRINDMAYGNAGGMFTIYFATDSGLYSFPHLWDQLEPKLSSPPKRFTLLQNTPNPFNPVTTIHYRLSATGPVTLTIYNALGQQVTRLVNKIQGPGYFSVQWNGKDQAGRILPSGVYYYRLGTSSKAGQTRKMVLLK